MWTVCRNVRQETERKIQTSRRFERMDRLGGCNRVLEAQENTPLKPCHLLVQVVFAVHHPVLCRVPYRHDSSALPLTCGAGLAVPYSPTPTHGRKAPKSRERSVPLLFLTSPLPLPPLSLPSAEIPKPSRRAPLILRPCRWDGGEARWVLFCAAERLDLVRSCVSDPASLGHSVA